MDTQLLRKRKAFIEDDDAPFKIPYVLDTLLKEGVLVQDEIDYIVANVSVKDKVRDLVDTVKRKGTTASAVLLDAWTQPLPDTHHRSEGDENKTIRLDGRYTRDQLIAFAYQLSQPSSSAGARARGCPVRLNIDDPEEFTDPPVFPELNLSAHQTHIKDLVVDVLENMYAAEVKTFMWHYSRNLRHADPIMNNRVELASVMLDYVSDDIHIYAERVYAKLRACQLNNLAENFRKDVLRVCNK